MHVVAPDDGGSPRSITWVESERLWTCTEVLEVDASSAESFEMASDVTGDLWDSKVLGSLPLAPHSKMWTLFAIANTSEFPLSLLTIQGVICASDSTTS